MKITVAINDSASNTSVATSLSVSLFVSLPYRLFACLFDYLCVCLSLFLCTFDYLFVCLLVFEPVWLTFNELLKYRSIRYPLLCGFRLNKKQ